MLLLMKNKKYYTLAGAVLLSTLMSACGGSAYRTQTDTSSNTGGSSSGAGSNSKSSGSTTTSTASASSSESDVNSEFLPSISQDFSVYGTSTNAGSSGLTTSFTTEELLTDNLLKVKVTSGAAGKINVSGSNYYADYRCVQYKVSLLNSNGTVLKAVTTSYMSVNGGSYNCPNAVSEQEIDFSNYMTSGHSAMRVRIQATGYDHYNLYWGYPQSMTSVYQNHTVTGNIAIQLNGTSL